jgi:hypothetical protein
MAMVKGLGRSGKSEIAATAADRLQDSWSQAVEAVQAPEGQPSWTIRNGQFCTHREEERLTNNWKAFSRESVPQSAAITF